VSIVVIDHIEKPDRTEFQPKTGIQPGCAVEKLLSDTYNYTEADSEFSAAARASPAHW
jgi:hypothetical protein